MGKAAERATGAERVQPVDGASWPIAVLTSAFCPDFEPQRLAMAICVGYVEPVETPDLADTFTVTSLISSKARWREFETRWSRTLRRESLPAFSADDFLRSSGPFAFGWNDDAHQQTLIDTLGKLTQQSIFHAFSCSIRLQDYHTVDAEYALSETGAKPYGLCAATLIATIRHWMRAKHPDDLTLFILRDGDVEQRELGRLLTIEQAKQGEPPQIWPRHWVDECGRNRYLRPLEACELLAADRQCVLTNRLLERGQLSREQIDRERLIHICHALNIARRSASPTADNRASVGTASLSRSLT